MTEKTIEYWNSRPEVYEMSYQDFCDEYFYLMPIMGKKEGQGNLDPHRDGYIPMTDEEVALHEKDWRAFSRLRGFSEYDIAEYGRWHKLTGQTDKLDYATNGHWRRRRDPALLYLQHLDYALAKGITLSEKVQKDYDEIYHRDNDDHLFGNLLKQEHETSADDDFDFDASWDDNSGTENIDWDIWDDDKENSLSKEKRIETISCIKCRIRKKIRPQQKINLALWKKMKNRTSAD